MTQSKSYFPTRTPDAWVTETTNMFGDADALERKLAESFRINEVPAHLLKTLAELRAADEARERLRVAFCREVHTAMLNARAEGARHELEIKSFSISTPTRDEHTLTPAA